MSPNQESQNFYGWWASDTSEKGEWMVHIIYTHVALHLFKAFSYAVFALTTLMQ